MGHRPMRAWAEGPPGFMAERTNRTCALRQVHVFQRGGRVHRRELGQRLREVRAVVAVVEDDVLGLAAFRELDDLAVARVAGEVEVADLALDLLLLAFAEVERARVEERAAARAGDLEAREEDRASRVVLHVLEVVERGPAVE